MNSFFVADNNFDTFPTSANKRFFFCFVNIQGCMNVLYSIGQRLSNISARYVELKALLQQLVLSFLQESTPSDVLVHKLLFLFAPSFSFFFFFFRKRRCYFNFFFSLPYLSTVHAREISLAWGNTPKVHRHPGTQPNRAVSPSCSWICTWGVMCVCIVVLWMCGVVCVLCVFVLCVLCVCVCCVHVYVLFCLFATTPICL